MDNLKTNLQCTKASSKAMSDMQLMQ